MDVTKYILSYPSMRLIGMDIKFFKTFQDISDDACVTGYDLQARSFGKDGDYIMEFHKDTDEESHEMLVLFYKFRIGGR